MKKTEKIDYLIDMAGRFPNMDSDPDKWNRWLGFLQGALWALDLKTIAAMREENRHDLTAALRKGIKTLREARKIPGATNPSKGKRPGITKT